jgi:threonine synthase
VEQGRIKPDELTVIAITGNGLKTQEAVQDHLARPDVISAKLSEFENRLLGALAVGQPA